MSDFLITTDNTADLPEEYLTGNEIPYAKLSYIIDGEVYEGKASFDAADFYGKIRNGCMPTTSQISIEEAKEFFEPFAKEGKDIIHIAFSSGLSGSYNNCCVAANELCEEYPGRKIKVVDSLCASLGEGLLVHYAVKMKKDGCTYDDLYKRIEELKDHICHFFTVDDLNHLYRGGRVSRFSAIAGSMIGIKPILHVDPEGHLIPIGKVRGRKASLRALVEHMKDNYIPDENDIIFISHGDCEEDALFVRDLVKEQYHIDSYLINYVGSVIGSHSGPGTVALFFVGRER